MNGTNRLVFSLCFWLLWIGEGQAQVFPGDADNNGKVENLDVLYTGYAYGEIGPARLGLPLDATEGTISLLWEASFPSGTNYAFADANGDGAINFNDLVAISLNYGLEHAMITTNVFLEGIPGLDPLVAFDRSAIPPIITENAILEIPLFIGTADRPIVDINGLAFSISYDSELIAELSLEIDPKWMGDDGEIFMLQSQRGEGNEGKLEVALTRFGKNPVTAFGRIGTLSIIIEDDLIDLLPDHVDRLPVAISVVGIGAVDDKFNQIPLVSDSIHLEVRHPAAISDARDSEKAALIKVFPNPIRGMLTIFSAEAMEQITILNLSGQTLLALRPGHPNYFKYSTQAFPPGPLLLKITTPKGIVVKKMVVMAE